VAIGGTNYILPADVPEVEADQETRLARGALSELDIVSDLQARGVRLTTRRSHTLPVALPIS
jgi:hypothetical protein